MLDIPFLAAFVASHETGIESLLAIRAVGLDRMSKGLLRVMATFSDIVSIDSDYVGLVSEVIFSLDFAGLYSLAIILEEWILEISQVSPLSLGGNKLTSIPESIGNLTELLTLDVSSNQLTSISESIGNLTKLTKLSLVRNELTSLPTFIGNLTSLTSLSRRKQVHLHT